MHSRNLSKRPHVMAALASSILLLGGLFSGLMHSGIQEAEVPEVAIPTPPASPRSMGLPRAKRHHSSSCRVPEVAIPQSDGCRLGLPYPSCRFRMPDPEAAGYLYDRWKSTTLDHWWGSPGLVTLILAVSAKYQQEYPGESLVVGDLDAPGPRHSTHRKGQDVDLYLPGMMRTENVRRYVRPSNYEGQRSWQVAAKRARVVELAKNLAICTDGRIRIYYNDEPVERRFLNWFTMHGYKSPFGKPMRRHNYLHRFHFHVSVPENMSPLPFNPPSFAGNTALTADTPEAHALDTSQGGQTTGR